MSSSAATSSVPLPSALLRPIESLDGVGPTRARQFQRLGVQTLGDLLEYFPRDYRYESSERAIDALVADQIQLARGEVVAVNYVPRYPRPRFEATLDDGSGAKLCLAWFHGGYLRTKIHPGLMLRVQGKVQFFRNLPQMVNPRWEVVDVETPSIDQARFRAVYPASERLPSELIGRIIESNLDTALAEVEEWFEPALLARRGLVGRRDAYRAIHRPAHLSEAMAARKRLIYDEMMLLQLGLGLSKRQRESRLTAPAMRADKRLDQRIRARFPFQLTEAQQRALWQIVADLRGDRPMNRLLQGDVGSGKTVVALYAMLVAVANKFQSALLAPTEVLAEQHYLTLNNLLKDSQVVIELFTHRTKRSSRSLARKLADGTIHIAVGTQAMLHHDVEFSNLALVVVDEQHRLGVRQRAVIKGKGLSPHYLVMTATPIPRTLALSYFADFDVSEIDELPPGRQPIKTQWLRRAQVSQAYEIVRRHVSAGCQAYVVLPQIDGDDGIDGVKSVTRQFEQLSKGALKGLRLAMLHGQMPTDQKQATMLAFRDGKIDVLVATTVIEVGIDVPNATVMLIDGAESFGLSQLHQLRGRIGRGRNASTCILLSDPPTESAEARLRAMTHTSSGFEIAEMDLKLRGPGEFFGLRQHGLPEFKLADLASETPLLQQARDDALAMLKTDAALARPTNRALRAALVRQWGEALALAQIG